MKTALALVLLTFMASAQDRVAEALREGIAEEETNHNLPAAIQAYESALKLFDADRETAATALFRLAACYQNQGKHEQAQAAYRRLAAQFPEQTRLIEQGRVWGDTASMKVRSDYRAALEEEIAQARKRQEFANEAGPAMSPVEAKKLQFETENQLTGLQAELAAFDAGLLPMQPAAPAGSEAADRRRAYRSFLERGVELASNLWKLTYQQVAAGVASQRQLADAQMRIARAKKDLAAFDAGLAPPPARPAQ
jgi:tetratricopeptide (TPR) repeat protein